MLEYVKKNLRKQEKRKRVYHIHDIPLNIINDFTNKINIPYVVDKLQKTVPKHLFKNVEGIYIANIKDFNKGSRTFNAMYKDGAIYISPDQDNDNDIIDDLVHEIAHSFEKEYHDLIYGDGTLEKEFAGKRRTLYFLLDEHPANMLQFKNINYSSTFDNYLYNNIGYDKLRAISSSLFYSPYAITSLREYWANGFENYLLGDRTRLKSLCPILCNKIYTILEE